MQVARSRVWSRAGSYVCEGELFCCSRPGGRRGAMEPAHYPQRRVRGHDALLGVRATSRRRPQYLGQTSCGLRGERAHGSDRTNGGRTSPRVSAYTQRTGAWRSGDGTDRLGRPLDGTRWPSCCLQACSLRRNGQHDHFLCRMLRASTSGGYRRPPGSRSNPRTASCDESTPMTTPQPKEYCRVVSYS